MVSLPSSIDLTELAKKALLERHLLPEFPPEVQKEVEQMGAVAVPKFNLVHDMREKLWFSVDNEDTKDLDQLTYMELLDQGKAKLYVAIADVDSLVKKNSFTDQYAQHNTTSIYTPTKIFSMLPEKLSNHLTSLNEREDRLAIVNEIIINPEGSLESYLLYPAYVRNQSKLSYNGLANWLDGKGPIPRPAAQVPGLAHQIQLQDMVAYRLKNYRHQQGALTLESIEPHAKLNNGNLVDLKVDYANRARDLIENFMIAANISTSKFLRDHQLPSLKRVVRIPKRWDRIVEIAKKYGTSLPEQPNSIALELFLLQRKLADPLRFPELSLTIIKLLGKGEYIVEYPGNTGIGHFSLAIKNYTHSTAPNRRFSDLIVQRLLKSIFTHQLSPYSFQELENLAKWCTLKENDAEKVERRMKKSAASFLLSSKIGQYFEGLITGSSHKGTWVRIFDPPVEGKLIQGFNNLDVGDLVKVKLVSINIEKGFIDFVKD